MKHLLILVLALFIAESSMAQHEHHAPAPPKKKTTAVKKAPAKKTAPAKKATQKAPAHKPATNETPDVEPMTDTMQHEHHIPDSEDHAAHDMTGTESMNMDMHDHDSMSMHAGHMQHMSHAFSLNLPMTRNGSGTAWLPDASPMFGYMMHKGAWMFMLHGNIFFRYNKQDLTDKGSRGDEGFDIPSMVMLMGQRPVGKKGLFHFNTMFSFDALVTGAKGYPLLFQSGETYEGQPLVDRQHPHDLFGELSVSYAHAFNKDVDAFVYLGYPGEPALGPATFMHRPSGMDNPDAPLSHHWIDATHITFGVATLGVRYRQFKLEASSFTGREPNENRYNFDKPLFDSRSARLSFNPTKNWSLQVSHAFIKSPEALHPHNVYRTTASATYAYRSGNGLLFNTTGLWGMNKQKGHEGEHAALLEASLRGGRLVGYGRYEWVQKSVEELALDEDAFGHDELFAVNALTIGAAYDVMQLKPVRASIGTQVTFYKNDKELYGLYGKNPLAGEVYLRIYPNLMQ